MQTMLLNGFDAETAGKEIAQMIRYSKDDFYHLKYLLEILREHPGQLKSAEVVE